MISESPVRSCEVGLLECGENAECVPKQNSKSKVGVCQCIEGFVFDTGGTCVETSVETKTEKTVIIQFLGGMFLFLLFHFHSFSSFSPGPFSSPLLSLLSPFSSSTISSISLLPVSGSDTK